MKNLKYLPFEEAKNFVWTLKLTDRTEWVKYCKGDMPNLPKKPDDIPSYPDSRYWKSWQGWNDWLNSIPTKKLKYLPFEKARDFARNLGLKTAKDWQRYCIGEIENVGIKPSNIPRSPEQVYRRDGWINYKDWLKTGLMSFEKARDFVKALNLTDRTEWVKYCKGDMPNLPKKPDDIPSYPDSRYWKSWINWEDWLTGDAGKIYGEWRGFKKARKFVRDLKLKGQIEWRKYCKGELEGYKPKPSDIPAAPATAYKDMGWIDIGDWLGTGRKRSGNNSDGDNTWLSYLEARAFVHKLKLKGGAEWKAYIRGELEDLPKKPDDIPSSAYYVYRDKGWVGMRDWLGT